jgi:hypothetical protein
MKRHRAELFPIAIVLLVACGSAGSTGTGGGSGTGGSGGNMTDVDASVDDAPPLSDSRADRVVTCEGRDGNTCSTMPDAPACRRCIQSCCCNPIAACRADAMCAAAIGKFNDCIQQGETGLACLVVAVESLPDAALFAAIADCVDMECGDLTCQL